MSAHYAGLSQCQEAAHTVPDEEGAHGEGGDDHDDAVMFLQPVGHGVEPTRRVDREDDRRRDQRYGSHDVEQIGQDTQRRTQIRPSDDANRRQSEKP